MRFGLSNVMSFDASMGWKTYTIYQVFAERELARCSSTDPLVLLSNPGKSFERLARGQAFRHL